jgi:hypothetical protein
MVMVVKVNVPGVGISIICYLIAQFITDELHKLIQD